MEHHLVTGVREKGRTAGHAGQDAALAFDAQILFESRHLCHPADQGLGLMGVQLITDDMPAGRFGLGRYDRLQMRKANQLRYESVHKREPGGGRSRHRG